MIPDSSIIKRFLYTGVVLWDAMVREEKDQSGTKRSVNHQELEQSIKVTFRAKNPIMVKGAPGIGKSQVAKASAKDIAEDMDRDFIQWSSLGMPEKKKIVDGEKEVDDYFLFVDIRLASYDPSDIKGIPSLDGDYNEWIPPMWLKAICRPETVGLVFLDEANLAPPAVQSSFYQLIHDGKVGSNSVSEEVHIMGAGNRAGRDKANIHEMAAPLKNRFDWLHLEPPVAGTDVEDGGNWIEWALKNGIDDRIIGFLGGGVGKDHLFRFEDNKDNDAFPTPRSWERASDLLKAVENETIENIKNAVSMAVGVPTAHKFSTFVEKRQDLNLEDFRKNPEKIGELEIDEMHAVMTGLAAEYEDNEDVLKAAVDIAYEHFQNGRNDLGLLQLRYCRRRNEKHFQDSLADENFARSEKFQELAQEYKKLLL